MIRDTRGALEFCLYYILEVHTKTCRYRDVPAELMLSDDAIYADPHRPSSLSSTDDNISFTASSCHLSQKIPPKNEHLKSEDLLHLISLLI